VAGEGEEPERAEHGGQRQHERNARRDERAEGEHEDQESDRERELPGLPEIVRERGLDRLLGARVSELADEELRVHLLRNRHAVEHRVDLVRCVVCVAADVEFDERRVLVAGDLACILRVERRAHVLDNPHRLDPAEDVLDHRAEGRIGDAKRAALNEDALAGGLLEALVEDPVHAAGLAGAGLVRVDRLRPDETAESEDDQDQAEPAE
jgi:hypothetical protein